MEQSPSGQSPSEQPSSEQSQTDSNSVGKPTEQSQKDSNGTDSNNMGKPSSYLKNLSWRAEKHFKEHPEDFVMLECKEEIDSPDASVFKLIENNPQLQQKLADLLNYDPSRWLLGQEIPFLKKRRDIHGISSNEFEAGKDPYEWARENRSQGMCFSGGGIRSATFNLGVLQGLAQLNIPAPERCKESEKHNCSVLSRFDYLSSVSGGGYIHEWLAAWIKREEKKQKDSAEKANPPKEYAVGDGFREVQKRLAPLPAGKDYPAHPEPIRWLRRYSNYLTPQKGLFTADTWVAVAIWLRNTFLNQLILISGLFFVLSCVYFMGRSTWCLPKCVSIVAAALLFLLATGTIAIQLRHELWRVKYMDDNDTDKPPQPPWLRGGEKTVEFLVVLPLLLAAWFYLSVAGASPAFEVFAQPSTEDFVVFALLWLLVALTAACGGSVTAFEALNPRDRAASWFGQIWQEIRDGVKGIGLLIVVNAALSALAGTLAFRGVRWMLWWDRPSWIASQYSLGPETWRFQTTFGPPLLLSVPFLTLVFGAGLVGRDFPDWLREWLARVRAWALLFGFASAILFGIVLLGPYFPVALKLPAAWMTPTKIVAAITWLGTTYGSVRAAWSNKTSGKPGDGAARSVPLDTLAKMGGYVFIVGLLVVLSFSVKRAIDYAGQKDSWLIWLLVIAGPLFLFILFGWRVDINDFSMNPFYRNRLTRCYLGASNGRRSPSPLTGFDNQDTRGMQVSRLTAEDKKHHRYSGPFPIFCTAINLSFGEDLAWQERKAASFAFTPLYSGYYVGWTAGAKLRRPVNICGFVSTENYAAPDGGINMATAVAISGAAASPNWGYHTDPATAFLMTMFNVRLGWWMLNPRRWEGNMQGGARENAWASPRFAPLELSKELLGMVNDTSKFVYLSDGGHFDNMGFYELVRRRCYQIVICDAEQDENYHFEGIANAIRKCRIDFGVEITLDLSDVRLVQETTNCKSHWARGRIRYPETPAGEEHEGHILYIKSSLTGASVYDMPEKPKPVGKPEKPNEPDTKKPCEHEQQAVGPAAGDAAQPAKKNPVDLPSEPVDVINYKFTHEHFPHDSTANQWFTESQFESYRRLGYHVIAEVERCGKWDGF
jgi:hypothetical protein